MEAQIIMKNNINKFIKNGKVYLSIEDKLIPHNVIKYTSSSICIEDDKGNAVTLKWLGDFEFKII